MRRVKEVLSDKFTIAGNVPASMMAPAPPMKSALTAMSWWICSADAPGYIMAFGCTLKIPPLKSCAPSRTQSRSSQTGITQPVLLVQGEAPGRTGWFLQPDPFLFVSQPAALELP
jgi:hypothetical protein